jgi:hypothetical protein
MKFTEIEDELLDKGKGAKRACWDERHCLWKMPQVGIVGTMPKDWMISAEDIMADDWEEGFLVF